MSYEIEAPSAPPQFHSNDDALSWVEGVVSDAEAARLACNIIVPEGGDVQAAYQRKAERIFLVRHGSAMGALSALLRCNKISDVAYNELVKRCRKTLEPSLIGRIG